MINKIDTSGVAATTESLIKDYPYIHEDGPAITQFLSYSPRVTEEDYRAWVDKRFPTKEDKGKWYEAFGICHTQDSNGIYPWDIEDGLARLNGKRRSWD